MLDRNSIVVAYDYLRGELRGRFKKGEDRKELQKGDCIDCHQCVHVCPTGIDIRNGTQLECVNCTACIDACDHIMESVGLPKGLIRYDSENGIVEQKRTIFSLRTIGYSIVLSLIVGLVSFLLISRSDVDATILKTYGQEYQKRENDQISNLYNFKIINKTFQDIDASIQLIDGKGTIEMIGNKALQIPSEAIAEGTFFLVMTMEDLNSRETEITLGIYDQHDVLLDKVNTSFLAPVKRKKK